MKVKELFNNLSSIWRKNLIHMAL